MLKVTEIHRKCQSSTPNFPSQKLDIHPKEKEGWEGSFPIALANATFKFGGVSLTYCDLLYLILATPDKRCLIQYLNSWAIIKYLQ